MSPSDDLDALQIGPDPDKLEIYHRQQLSAMLDGELSQDQARFMRRRLQHDVELSACFERWQVCGDVLRGRRVSLLPTDFAERVTRGIAAGDSVAVVAADVARRPRLLRWGGGAALAASVALVALFVGRTSVPGELGNADELPQVASVAAGNADGAVAGASDAVAEGRAGDPLADAGAMLAQAPAEAPQSPDAAAALAVAGAAVAVAELPRRNNGERRSARGQSQRAALRVQQAQQDSGARAVAAAAPPRPQATTVAGFVPDAAQADAGAQLQLVARDDAPFALPAAPVGARPWPRAAMPGLDGGQTFSVRYDDAFPAPSWAGAQTGSGVLPSFPVEPAAARSEPGTTP
ncbi:sigma-E factor negative regulatory protein [Luteimonas sp. BDR2-5]|uniref:sigma-E factor negative regulatory protein n=1 Tax=Proluteimonas luteida TaxID=2878685 RepID=UPI001E4D2FAA|nr:sigma-E factor negative regulatory protein [Luteimonas sp. BDR2-5]MCD9028456.1 sigma-E factor negative regulatory protein [Luteimonas sp. BDR2-5]